MLSTLTSSHLDSEPRVAAVLTLPQEDPGTVTGPSAGSRREEEVLHSRPSADPHGKPAF